MISKLGGVGFCAGEARLRGQERRVQVQRRPQWLLRRCWTSRQSWSAWPWLSRSTYLRFSGVGWRGRQRIGIWREGQYGATIAAFHRFLYLRRYEESRICRDPNQGSSLFRLVRVRICQSVRSPGRCFQLLVGQLKSHLMSPLASPYAAILAARGPLLLLPRFP
jgi:hypothetical protein